MQQPCVRLLPLPPPPPPLDFIELSISPPPRKTCPTQVLEFTGIMLYSVQMQARLPEHHLMRTRTVLSDGLEKGSYSSVQYSLLRHDYVYLAALDNLHIESGCPLDLHKSLRGIKRFLGNARRLATRSPHQFSIACKYTKLQPFQSTKC